jgi:hypothetical protein
MPMSKPNWWTNPPAGVKYAVTLVSVASAVIVAWVLWHFWHSEAFASVFFCAIIFSASTERISLTEECGWKDGDRGGLAEWEQTHGKKKAKCALTSTGLLMEGLGLLNVLT